MRAIAWCTFHSRLKTRSPVTQELFGGGDGGAVDQKNLEPHAHGHQDMLAL